MGIVTDARRPYREGRPRLRLSAVCIFSEHHGATVQIESRDAQSFRSAGTPIGDSENQHWLSTLALGSYHEDLDQVRVLQGYAEKSEIESVGVVVFRYISVLIT